MMATLTNGSAPSGYIPHDAAYGQNTFEVVVALEAGLCGIGDRQRFARSRRGNRGMSLRRPGNPVRSWCVVVVRAILAVLVVAGAAGPAGAQADDRISRTEPSASTASKYRCRI